MHLGRSTSLVVAALAAAGAASAGAVVLAQDGGGRPGHGGHGAARLFEARCASCHVVPDPGIETDLAWLGQIRDTA